MQIAYYSESSPRRAPGELNEDFVIAGPDWAVVLDGATPQPQFPIGCVHGVAWYVRHLAGKLAVQLATSEASLPDVLASAITSTRDAHGGQCDLSNRASPSSTVAMVRKAGQQFEYLALADSPMIFDVEGKIETVVDDRNIRIPDRNPETIEAYRNRPDGYWVASTDPDAAHHALTGVFDVVSLRSVALLTDGASRWVDRFELGSWAELLSVLALPGGPMSVVSAVRTAETCAEGPATTSGDDKRHDDATALVCASIGNRDDLEH
jgi:hypothetical protein